MRVITKREELNLRPSLDILFKDLDDLENYFALKIVDLILGGNYFDFDDNGYYYEINFNQACLEYLLNTETVWYLINDNVILEIFPNKVNENNNTGLFLKNLIKDCNTLIKSMYYSITNK